MMTSLSRKTSWELEEWGKVIKINEVQGNISYSIVNIFRWAWGLGAYVKTRTTKLV